MLQWRLKSTWDWTHRFSPQGRSRDLVPPEKNNNPWVCFVGVKSHVTIELIAKTKQKLLLCLKAGICDLLQIQRSTTSQVLTPVKYLISVSPDESPLTFTLYFFHTLRILRPDFFFKWTQLQGIYPGFSYFWHFFFCFNTGDNLFEEQIKTCHVHTSLTCIKHKGPFWCCRRTPWHKGREGQGNGRVRASLSYSPLESEDIPRSCRSCAGRSLLLFLKNTSAWESCLAAPHLSLVRSPGKHVCHHRTPAKWIFLSRSEKKWFNLFPQTIYQLHILYVWLEV